MTTHTAPDLEQALHARQFTLLDRHFQALHDGHHRGTLDESDLDAAYRLFNTYHADMTAPLRAWAAHSPGYAAQVSLGLHLFNRALSLRTMRRAHDIPEANIADMTAAFTEAWTLMTGATHLNPQATHAHVTLIFLCTQRGERAWEQYLGGIQRAPSSMLLRRAMLANLRTEWGGSERDMHAFLSRAEHTHLPQADQDNLHAIFWRHVGHHRHMFMGDRHGALAAYEQSLSIAQTADTLAAIGSLTGGRRGRRMLDAATRLEPHNLHLKARRAVAYLKSWRPAGPYLRDLEECRTWGEPYATDILSDTPRWLIPVICRFAALTGQR